MGAEGDLAPRTHRAVYEAEMRDNMNMSEAIDGGMGLSGVGGSLPDASTGSYHGKGWDVCETRSRVCFGSLWACAMRAAYRLQRNAMIVDTIVARRF